MFAILFLNPTYTKVGIGMEIVGSLGKYPVCREVSGIKTSLLICCMKIRLFMLTALSEIKCLGSKTAFFQI